MFFKPLLNKNAAFGDFGALSIIIGKTVLIDAGSVIATLPREELMDITDIFITHAHLDHIKDLGFIGESLYGVYKHTVNVWGTAKTLEIIQNDVFNGRVWADFTKLPNQEKPILSFNQLEIHNEYKIGNYMIKPVPVNHCPGAVGLIISVKGENVIITGDTGPTDEIWRQVNELKGNITIYIETSFPNRMLDVARQTGHMTPGDLKGELDKISKKDAIIYICHIKIPYYKEVTSEITQIKDPRIRLLE